MLSNLSALVAHCLRRIPRIYWNHGPLQRQSLPVFQDSGLAGTWARHHPDCQAGIFDLRIRIIGAVK
jgi:hypothetical protein